MKPNTQHEKGTIGVALMLILALAVGVIAGFGAVIFRLMISVFHNLLFYGQFSWHYDANIHALPSTWGTAVILVPVVGALGVAWLVKTFAPEAKGHGVPEVIDAIYYNQGKIRPVVALFKSIASALSIGSGGSVGREGPIIQIGAAFGSTLGQIINMPVRQRVILIAAGAGAGIAGTFNAPIGGVAFAIELLLISINSASISVVAVATITAAYIGRAYLGMAPAFDIPALTIPTTHTSNLVVLATFIPFGIVVGVLSTLFIHSIYWFEDRFEALPFNYYFQHMLGMLIVGILIYCLMHYAGHYYVQGVGYATIVDVLTQALTNPWLLLLLCGLKLLATGLTLGSGASGGVFSPSLFIGATLGGAAGSFIQHYFPGLGVGQEVFAIAGMAGMVSGSTGAVLTAVTMLFEMTRDYHAILPIILTVALAYQTRTLLSRESIYTLKLLRRGHVVHEGLQAAIHAAQTAKDVMSTAFQVVTEKELEHLKSSSAAQQADVQIIAEHGAISGVIPHHVFVSEIAEAQSTNYLQVDPETPLLEILRMMQKHGCDVVLVTDDPGSKDSNNLVGVISHHDLVNITAREALLMH